jgi:hypothetical protein
MDHFSYELMGKEKVKSFQEEGLRSQEVHKSRVSQIGFLRSLPKLIFLLLGILGILGLLIR